MLEERRDPIRIAFYTRISTDEDHQKYSLDAQSDRLHAYCRAQYDRWVQHKLYADTSTGTNMERPGLKELLAEARAKKFDMVLVFRVDRLSRNVRQLSGMVEEFMRLGVVLKSATEPFDTSNSAGKMMLQMLGVFAEFEHATIVERTRAGMQRKARNGEWCGGGIPFGYQLVQGEGLKILEEEATVVRLIYDLYTGQRLGSVAIARHLNEHGHRRKRGRKWSSKEVLDLIRRPVYAGTIRWSGIEQDGTHEPIIDRAKWALAQSILQKRGEDSMSRLSNRSDFLLTGHIHCGSCGKLMVGCSGHKDGRKMNYYACRGRLFYGKGDCGQDYVRADHLEGLIVEEIGALASSPEFFNRIIAEA
jgi:site-specific DNA recombinase